MQNLARQICHVFRAVLSIGLGVSGVTRKCDRVRPQGCSAVGFATRDPVIVIVLGGDHSCDRHVDSPGNGRGAALSVFCSQPNPASLCPPG